jgi:flagellar protein FliO/FliZ
VLELLFRVVVSLAVVLGLFWLVARTGARKLNGGQRGLLRVRGRQSLSRSASLAVVEVGGRVLVVGVSDNGVRLLTEMDPAELDELPEPATAPAGEDAEQPVEFVGAAHRVVQPVGTAHRVVRPVQTEPRPVAPGEPAESPSFHAIYQAALAATAAPDHTPEVRTPTMTPVRTAGPTGVPAAGRATVTAPGRRSDSDTGALSGSLLSGSTWRLAWQSATGRPSRRQQGRHAA